MQRRLYACGLAKDDVCRCGRAAGTLWHKLGVSELAKEAREDFNEPELFKVGGTAVWDPLFSRGVSGRPKLPKQPSAREWWRAHAHDAGK